VGYDAEQKAPDAARGFGRLPVEPGMCPWGAWPILLERRRQEEVEEKRQREREHKKSGYKNPRKENKCEPQ
jgi:hypothetical protein